MDVPTKDPSEIGVERAFRECMNVASSPQSETNWTSKDGTLNSPGPITVSNGDYYSDSTSCKITPLNIELNSERHNS